MMTSIFKNSSKIFLLCFSVLLAQEQKPENLIDLLKSKDKKISSQATDSLLNSFEKKIFETKAFSKLARATKSNDKTIQEEAFTKLKQLSNQNLPLIKPLETLIKDEDKTFRLKVFKIIKYSSFIHKYAENLEGLDLTLPILIQGLKDKEEDILREVLFALGSLREKANGMAPFIEDFFKKSQGDIKERAAWALESITGNEYRDKKTFGKLQAEDWAPLFSGLDQDGLSHSLSDYYGKWVLVYFYPKNNSPNCTREACRFRDYFPELKVLVDILGVSSDDIASHSKFATKYELPFTLIADPKQKIIEQYEAKGFFFTKRYSYLVNPMGKIVKIYREVRASKHALEVLNDLKLFQKE